MPVSLNQAGTLLYQFDMSSLFSYGPVQNHLIRWFGTTVLAVISCTIKLLTLDLFSLRAKFFAVLRIAARCSNMSMCAAI